jgi:hypothetical protein
MLLRGRRNIVPFVPGPEPEPVLALELTFDDIANVPVADAFSVSDWNTFFDLPTNGTEFSSVEVIDNSFVSSKYGLYYNYLAVSNEGFTSSDEWEVPMLDDFVDLIHDIGGIGVGVSANAQFPESSVLLENETGYWPYPSWATNVLNFNLKPSGYISTSGSYQIQQHGQLHSKELINGKTVSLYTRQDQGFDEFDEPYSYQPIYINNNGTTTTGYPVRLFRMASPDELLLSDGTYCTDYVGNNGNRYKSVKIGLRVWLNENLFETKYRNGAWIRGFDGGVYTTISNTDWGNLTIGALRAYNDDLNLAYNSGAMVRLIGGSGIHAKDNLFYSVYEYEGEYFFPLDHLTLVEDNAGCIISAGTYSFNHQTQCTNFKLPELVSAGASCLSYCNSVTHWYLPKLEEIGHYCFYFQQNDAALSSALEFDLPELVTAGDGSFAYNRLVTDFKLPKLVTLTQYGAGWGTFLGCIGVSKFEFLLLETISNRAFTSCLATEFNLPSATAIGVRVFRLCTGATKIYLPSVTDLGGTTGNDEVFINITGKTIELTIPAALMTCNGGDPDGDIQYLQANNTVTIITV